jgi:hypothetical protein
MIKLSKKAKAKRIRNQSKSKHNQFKKELAKKILNSTGKHFTGMFKCDLCNVTHTQGYVYQIDNVEYEICKFCNDRIHHKENYIRIIYTPMGNNQ